MLILSILQSILRGMNELSGSVSPSSENRNSKNLIDRVYQTANLLQVQSTNSDTLKWVEYHLYFCYIFLLHISVTEQGSPSKGDNYEHFAITYMNRADNGFKKQSEFSLLLFSAMNSIWSS